MIVNGRLEANGTNENPIIFTSNSSNPKPGDWGGIKFTDDSGGSTQILKYCTISYGGYGVHGVIYGDSSFPEINYCKIINNTATGIYYKDVFTKNYVPSITNNYIAYNTPGQGPGGGFWAQCIYKIKFYNNIFYKNKSDDSRGGSAIYIMCMVGSGFEIFDNVFVENTPSHSLGGAIYLNANNTSGINMRRNTFYKNISDIKLDHAISNISNEIESNTFIGDTSDVASIVGMGKNKSSKVSIKYNNFIKSPIDESITLNSEEINSLISSGYTSYRNLGAILLLGDYDLKAENNWWGTEESNVIANLI
ncbi:uncharacterized protein METZ01_LOCUS366491, partial [marine metagenome]